MEEQPSDSESPACTANMSGSQDSDSGSEYLSAEEELRTEGGGRAVSPSQAAPASHAASPTPAVDRQPPDRGGTEGQSDRQPPDRGNTEGQSDRQPPDRGNTEGQSDRQPPDRGNTEGQSDRQPPDRGNTEGQSDRQPPDRGNTEGESDSQIQETEEEPSAPWPDMEEGGVGRKEGRQPEEKEGLAKKARTAGDSPSTASESGERVSSQRAHVTSVAEDAGVPCLVSTALPTSAIPSQTAPVARGPGDLWSSGQVSMQGGQGNIGIVHNVGRIGRLGSHFNNPSSFPGQMHGGQGNIITVNNYGRIDSLGGTYNLKSIAARTRTNLERACPQGYVETIGFYRALMVMKKHNCCIITGTSGSGKTTMARHLLMALQSKGYMALEFIKPSECECVPWDSVDDENLKLVLLVDNVLGAGNFEDKLRRKWEIQLKPMKPFIERGNVLVILASRTNIYAAIRGVKEPGQVLYEAPEVSLLGEDCKLTNQERELILRKTLTFHKVKLPDQMNISNIIWASISATKIGFPQLCVYMATNPTALSDPETFFENPVQFLEEGFRKLKLDDKVSYFVLILVLQERFLLESVLNDKEKEKSFQEVAKLVGLSAAPGRGQILEVAKQLCGSYLEYSSKARYFSFIHQSVWDVLFSDICHSDFEKAASVCTFKQVVMYVRTDPECEEREEFVYIVPPCDWPILAKRLLEELTSDDVDLACSHPCLQHLDFVQKLLEILTDTDISRLLETQQKKKDVSFQCEKLECWEIMDNLCALKSHTVTIFSFQSCISYLLLGRISLVAKHILQSAQFQALSPSTQSQLLTEALPCALYVSDPDMVDWLLDRGAVPSEECVRAACCAEQEHVRLVKRALQWNSVLSAELLTEMARVACQKDRPRTLELLLSRLPKSAITQAELDAILAEVIFITHPKNVHSKLVLRRRKQKKHLPLLPWLLSILKKAGAQFKTHIDPHAAAGHPDPRPLSEWLNHTVDWSATDKLSYTPLHHAAETGALNNVQGLLHVMESTGQFAQLVNVQTREREVTDQHLVLRESNLLKPRSFRNDGQTALHLAAGNGRLAVMEALLKKKCKRQPD